MAEFQLIDDPEGFDAVVKALEGEDEIVLDLEADSFFHYKARICLAQIAVPGHCWIVDPFFEGFDHACPEFLRDIRRGLTEGPQCSAEFARRCRELVRSDYDKSDNKNQHQFHRADFHAEHLPVFRLS